MYWLAKHYLRFRGWTINGTFPPDPKFIAIGAPHTANFDFIVFLGVLGHFGKRARFIGKASLFKGPLGWLMRKLGGIPVQRDHPEGLVGQTVAAFAEADEMILVLAPEGTRGRSTR
jgi:1-acyl-sn-glycerol-3-phosphate acyltransferase